MSTLNGVELYPLQEALLNSLYVSHTTDCTSNNFSNLSLDTFSACTSQDLVNTGYVGHMYSPYLHISSPSTTTIENVPYTMGTMSDLASVQPVSQQMQEIGYQDPFDYNYIYCPTFEVLSNPTVSVDNILHRRFNIVDKGVGGICQEISAESISFQFDPIENRFALIDFS